MTASGAGRKTRLPGSPRARPGPPARRGLGRKSRAGHPRGEACVAARRVWVAAVGGSGVMAVETLTPDWEFDRVDDGSQSKGALGEAGASRFAAVGPGASRGSRGGARAGATWGRGPASARTLGAAGLCVRPPPGPAGRPRLHRSQPWVLVSISCFFFFFSNQLSEVVVHVLIAGKSGEKTALHAGKGTAQRP